MSRVMLVGFEKKDAAFIERIYQSVAVPCENVATLEAAFERIVTDPPALVLADRPGQPETLYNLKDVLKSSAPATPFIVALPDEKVPLALECMRAGAFDCVPRPFDKLDILAASKRACAKQNRALFVEKILPRKKKPIWPLVALILSIVPVQWGLKTLEGPPAFTVSLGSANLSGLQWEGRHLWVGDWFDATVTRYKVAKGVFEKFRVLETEAMYRSGDSQPILVCNTPKMLYSLGADLKMRIHHRAVGLPTLQTVTAPGTNPTGLAWDGAYVWSCDGASGKLYRHGEDLRVLESLSSPVPKPVGLAAMNGTIWVLGGDPWKLVKLERHASGYVWRGPYYMRNVFTEGINPSGMSVGYGRLWLISGGDPRMMSLPLDDLKSIWEDVEPKKEKA